MLDMIYLNMPDSVPQIIYEQAQLTENRSTVRQMTYGVCKFAISTKSSPVFEDSSVNAFAVDQLMVRFLPKELQEKFFRNELSFDQRDWIDDWSRTFKVEILRHPSHGKMVNSYTQYTQYLPDVGYIGKDRVDFLVTGKDDKGHPIAMTLIYYINVLEDKDFDKNSINKTAYQNALKKYCGVRNESWRISDSQLSEEIYQKYLSLGTADFSAWLTDANRLFSGFQNFESNILAQTTGTGLSAQITLDTDAAGYGWFVDKTPLDNSEYLPTSNPNVWIAKEGSATYGKMNLYTVLMHDHSGAGI